MSKRKRLPKWTPFENGTPPPLSAELVAKGYKHGVFFINSRYQVEVRELSGTDAPADVRLWHLSIKRHDKDVVGAERFRDFQRIKNELVGEETEAVELYPAESRLVDTSNQYHLWCIEGAEPGAFFGFGYGERRIVVGHSGGPGSSRQHPFEPGTAPADAETLQTSLKRDLTAPLDPGIGAVRAAQREAQQVSGPLSGDER
jgi:hypothetical protein